MGAMLCRRLATRHEVIPIGTAGKSDHELGSSGAYRPTDLNQPPAAADGIRGADIIVHAQPHDPAIGDGAAGEAQLLERISRGTYVLAQAAVEAGIGRLILISQISLFDTVSVDFVVTADWQPRPAPQATSLAPYMAELVCREIARVGLIEAVALRMGELDEVGGTSADDAVAAVEEALAADPASGGYLWSQRHVVSGGYGVPGRD
jgi:nucleoside-diphosphate-sugar epimerase